MNIDTRNNNTNFTSSIRVRYFLENGIEYHKTLSMPLINAVQYNKTFRQKLGLFDREFKIHKQKLDLAFADGYLFTGTTAKNYTKAKDKRQFIKNATAPSNRAIRIRSYINKEGEYSGDILELQVIINSKNNKIGITDLEVVKEGSEFFKKETMTTPQEESKLKIPSWAKKQSAYALEIDPSAKPKKRNSKPIPGQQSLNFDT